MVPLCSSYTLWEGKFRQFLIFMELEPFTSYFIFTKTLNLSNEKLEFFYLDQYPPRKERTPFGTRMYIFYKVEIFSKKIFKYLF